MEPKEVDLGKPPAEDSTCFLYLYYWKPPVKYYEKNKMPPGDSNAEAAPERFSSICARGSFLQSV